MKTLSEFSLIDHYFTQLTRAREDVVLGIGDDCALLDSGDKSIAVSIDTLVEGVHFFADVDPVKLGYKSLAVSLSDLAAMGATPAWFTLALTLPETNPRWLQGFAQGLASLAEQHHIQLVGGDTTHGPLTISIQVHGLLDKKQALRRDGAKAGDLIYVSGSIGDAGAALRHRIDSWQPETLNEDDFAYFRQRLELPSPRVDISQKIIGLATAAIDISDGLLADLGHILEKSQVGAELALEQLPLSLSLAKLDKMEAYQLALGSGDDYELCFTVPQQFQADIEALNLDIQCIGQISDRKGLILTRNDEVVPTDMFSKGYDHFNH